MAPQFSHTSSQRRCVWRSRPGRLRVHPLPVPMDRQPFKTRDPTSTSDPRSCPAEPSFLDRLPETSNQVKTVSHLAGWRTPSRAASAYKP